MLASVALLVSVMKSAENIMANVLAENVFLQLYLITFKTAHSKSTFIGVTSNLVRPTNLPLSCTFRVTYCL